MIAVGPLTDDFIFVCV